jgi:hypothetical protein
MKKTFAIVAILALLAGTVGTGQPDREEVVLVQANPGIQADLKSLGFLKGTWTGKVGNDWVEETWSAPHGDGIIGMFRWQVGGTTTTMWELLSIKDEGGVPVLRLRHFDQKLNPWPSEAGEVERMPAAEVTSNRVRFVAALEGGAGLKSVEYKCPSAEVLEVTIRYRDAARPPLEFNLKREDAK